MEYDGGVGRDEAELLRSWTCCAATRGRCSGSRSCASTRREGRVRAGDRHLRRRRAVEARGDPGRRGKRRRADVGRPRRPGAAQADPEAWTCHPHHESTKRREPWKVTFTSSATGRAPRCPVGRRSRTKSARDRRAPTSTCASARTPARATSTPAGRLGAILARPREERPEAHHVPHVQPAVQGGVGQHRGVPARGPEARGAGAVDGGQAPLPRVPDASPAATRR